MKKLHILVATAVLVSLAASHVVAASWQFTSGTDNFDGSTKNYISTTSGDREYLVIRPSYADGTIPSTKALSLMWQPDAVYICETNESSLVDWMVVDASGAQVVRVNYSNWEVSADGKALFAKRRGESLMAPGYTDAELVIGAMTMDNAAEIRLQITDDCGTHYLSKFSLEGVKAAIMHLAESAPRSP